MNKRWAHSQKSGFTIIELIIVIAVVAILAAITVLAYNNVQKNAADKAIKSDLQQVSAEMQRYQLKNAGAYPTTLPSEIKASPNVTLTLKRSGTVNYYGSNMTPVQNGVLMAQICTDLISEGLGKGLNQAGETNDYITGCGNWNHGSMQFTGWDSKVWTTPVSDTTLLNYADTFTTNDAWNKSLETVVKNFYHALVDRQVRQGGSYPITTFWDSWASPGNGVQAQPLPTPEVQPWYCVEATSTKYSELKWHITDELRLEAGTC